MVTSRADHKFALGKLHPLDSKRGQIRPTGNGSCKGMRLEDCYDFLIAGISDRPHQVAMISDG